MKYVTVQLKGGCYSFRCFDEAEIGDIVVCDTVNGFVVGEVISLESSIPEAKVLKEVVAIVDTRDFEDRKRNAERKSELKKKMDKKIKQLQDVTLYERFAEHDSELADMLAEYKTLE